MANNTLKKRIGTMPCEGSRCKSHDKQIPVVVFENSRATLSYCCDYCDRAPYARTGTDQHADWMQDIEFFNKPAKPAAPVAAPAEPAKGNQATPVAKPKESSTLFG